MVELFSISCVNLNHVMVHNHSHTDSYTDRTMIVTLNTKSDTKPLAAAPINSSYGIVLTQLDSR